MTQDEFFDIVLDSEARAEATSAAPASRRAFTEERAGSTFQQDDLFQWIHELTL